MVNTPIPHSLRSETVKAAKILQDFTIPSASSGPDKIIPGASVSVTLVLITHSDVMNECCS